MALDGKINLMLKELFNILMMNMMYAIKLGKKNELLNLNLSEIEDLNETYDDYIDSSDEFDQYYKNFGKKKTLVVDKNIFNDIYETKKNNKKIEIYKRSTEL